MELLLDHSVFEALIGRQESEKPLPGLCIVYFTASWCGPCRRLRLADIMGCVSPTVHWYKCDIDANSYTAGFCNIRSIPTFMIIHDKKIVATLSNSDSDKVIAWLRATVPQSK
jgi:thioredoxin-like negative regulator of GroEL